MFSFESPPTPTTTREDDLSVLRLIRSRRVGPATFHRLLAEHGSAAAALDALPAIAAAAGIDGYTACPSGVAAAELAAGERAGARLLRFDSPAYPAFLREIPDAPPVLWVRGNPAALHRPMVAVVGSRNASSLGLRMARGLAHALAEAGVSVTAGLARGIDTAAHEASCGRGTVAVMAGGIDVIYPAENRTLADRICETGCLVTEQPPGLEPVARHFPARNRIVSGLSAGIVVVEAAHRSGTLITARSAAEQGREVMAVPGHPIDARASGCNALIRDGATLVRNAEDVLAAIGMADLAEGPLRRRLSGRNGGGADQRGPAEGRDDGARRAGPAPTDGGGGHSPPPAGAQGEGRGAHGPSRDAAAGRAPRHLSGVERARSDALTGPHEPCDPRSCVTGAEGRACHAGATALPDEKADRASPRRPGTGTEGAHSAMFSPVAGRTPGACGDDLLSRVLALLGPSAIEEDCLIRDLGIPPARLAPVLLDLELDGRIARLPGGRIALVP